jgi:hypothetical protein
MELHYLNQFINIPDLAMLHHFKTACKAVEQVIECEISGLNL